MDQMLLTWVHEVWTHPLLDGLMVGLTTLGLAWCGLLTAWSLWRGPQRLGRALLLGQALALVGALFFYALAARVRPEVVRLVLEPPALPSFPSGHAAIAAATVTVWWLVLGWNRRTAALLLLALGVAYSRLYLGHHYPTDVLAGLIWGVGAGGAAYGLTALRLRLSEVARWLLWPQVALALLVTIMAYAGLLPLHLLRWPLADKLFHFLLFGALAFWLNLWLNDWQVRVGTLRLPVAVALPFGVAVGEEMLQGTSPLRTFDLGDLVANLVGLVAFYAISHALLARRQTEE